MSDLRDKIDNAYSEGKSAEDISSEVFEGLMSPTSQTAYHYPQEPIKVHASPDNISIEDATKKDLLSVDKDRAGVEMQELFMYLEKIMSSDDSYNKFMNEYNGWEGDLMDLIDQLKSHAGSGE